MPSNKNAVIRYRVLDRCFRNTGRRYYIDDLIGACSDVLSEMSPEDVSISRRTILNDIAFMESEAGWGSRGIDILHIKDEDGRRVYYRYADTSFSIDNTPLTTVEISQLHSAIETLAQFKGLPQFEWMGDILQKLECSTDEAASAIIGFDSNPYLKGIEYVGDIYKAIKEQQVLSVRYRAFGWDKDETFVFHPYYLKQYNNRWFVFGYNATYGAAEWNFAVDRIEAAEPLPHEQYIASETDWEEFFSDIIGVSNTKDTQPEEIILHCYGKCGKYIENKPIHESQRHKWIATDCLEVRLQLKPNFELESYILGQADGIKVVSPQWLQDKIIRQLMAAIELY